MANNRKLVFGLTLVLAGLYAWHYLRGSGAPTYATVPIERGDIRSIVSANGTCNALVTVQVGSQVSGNIKSLYVDFNSRVHKGELVAEIDPAPFRAKVDQAQAALDTAKAAVAEAQAVAEKAEVDTRSARAQRDSDEAAVKTALSVEQDSETKFARRENLTTVISDEDLETAKTAYDVAVAEREAAEAQREAADAVIRADQDQHESAVTQVQGAIDEVHQAEAALAQAQLDLAHTRITAPIDGVVISGDMDVGQTVSASFQAPTLFEIAQDLSQMQVDVNIDESDVGKLKLEQKAVFTVDALPGTTFDAIVKQIRKAPINVQNVITYDVVMAVANPELKLFPGMTANVRVLADLHRNVLKVRNTAFRYRPGNLMTTVVSPGQEPPKVLYVLDAMHKVIPLKAGTGISDGTYSEITSGEFQEGDEVIVSEAHA